jgi:hypothetical protein
VTKQTFQPKSDHTTTHNPATRVAQARRGAWAGLARQLYFYLPKHSICSHCSPHIIRITSKQRKKDAIATADEEDWNGGLDAAAGT